MKKSRKESLFEIYRKGGHITWVLKKRNMETSLMVIELLRIVIDLVHDDMLETFGNSGTEVPQSLKEKGVYIG